MSAHKRLVILDMHAILHRGYHALPDFSSTKGEPTGALYGLISILVKIITDLKPDYIVAAFDLPKPTYRHLIYKEYKAGRAQTDDALGTIVEKVKNNKDIESVIASGDMDTMQLVDGTKVQVFTPKKGLSETVLYDEAAVIARYGFKPEYVPDYKGLRGDPSDNIPGVKGIGEKTATILITKCGSLE